MLKEGSGNDAESSRDLLARARGGDSRAISALFRRQGRALRRWATGRLPRWARAVTDTADVVQDVLLQTFRHLDRFEDRGQGALRAYLRQAVVNRINDELRRITRRPTSELDDELFTIPALDSSPFDAALDAERERQYKQALTFLTNEERLLVVARIECGYTYDQLALIRGRATAEAARLAVRRAVTKLAERLPSV